MKSQYLEAYKEMVYKESKKGMKPLSVGTFLVYRLRGKSKNWLGRYRRSLINCLEKDGWIPCESKLKGLAYKPYVVVSKAGIGHGWGSDLWKWVSGLSKEEQELVKSDKGIVLIDNCPLSGRGNKTGTTLRKVVYKHGKYTHRLPY